MEPNAHTYKKSAVAQNTGGISITDMRIRCNSYCQKGQAKVKLILGCKNFQIWFKYRALYEYKKSETAAYH